MSEQVFFNQGSVQVTRTRIVIDNRTYPVNGITSIRTAGIPPSRTGSVLLGVFGLIALFASRGQGGVILLGLVFIAIAVYLWLNAKHTYIIFFGTAGGEQQALSNPDKDYVNNVASAINEALIARG